MSFDLPPRCARCVNFEATGPSDVRGSAPGFCRADPPRFDPEGGQWGAWPRVLSGKNWCARFVQRERRRAAA